MKRYGIALFVLIAGVATFSISSLSEDLKPSKITRELTEKICKDTKSFAKENDDEELFEAYKRHCKADEPDLFGLLAAMYHLSIDLENSTKKRLKYYRATVDEIDKVIRENPQIVNNKPIFWLNRSVNELSGFSLDVEGQRIYSTGDSGTGPFIAMTDIKSKRSTRLTVQGAKNRDWEALAFDGKQTLWLLDVGDNKSEHKHIYFHAIDVNSITSKQIQVVKTLELKYPKGPMDVEAGFYYKGYIYLIEKKYYKKAHFVRVSIENKHPEVEDLGKLPMTGPITDAVVSSDGRLFVLHYYGLEEIKKWQTPEEASINIIANLRLGQVEALALVAPGIFWIGREDGAVYEYRMTKPH